MYVCMYACMYVCMAPSLLSTEEALMPPDVSISIETLLSGESREADGVNAWVSSPAKKRSHSPHMHSVCLLSSTSSRLRSVSPSSKVG